MTADQLESIWVEFAAVLRRFIAGRVANRSDADDLLQDVFLKLQQGSKRPADLRNPTAWLYRFARNAIIDHHRRRRGASSVHDDIAEELDGRDEAELKRSVAEAVTCMLKGLPESDQQALRLADMNGQKQEDVAAELGVSLSAAKSRIQRAREKLRDLLDACCRLEFDRRGAVIACESKGGDCDCP